MKFDVGDSLCFCFRLATAYMKVLSLPSARIFAPTSRIELQRTHLRRSFPYGSHQLVPTIHPRDLRTFTRAHPHKAHQPALPQACSSHQNT
jgi:hypothetical protein